MFTDRVILIVGFLWTITITVVGFGYMTTQTLRIVQIANDIHRLTLQLHP